MVLGNIYDLLGDAGTKRSSSCDHRMIVRSGLRSGDVWFQVLFSTPA